MRFMYDKNIKKQQSVPIPVISVGNITFGGSEKTPLAVKLLKVLIKRGLNPAFVSRGYKGKWEQCGGEVLPQDNHKPAWRTLGDEPYMAAKNVPEAGFFLGKNRIASCRRASQKGHRVAVLDDGFQYYPLKKDLDIVLHKPSANTPLRESWTALKRAHIILLKKDSSKSRKAEFRSRFPSTPLYEYSVLSKGFIKTGTSQLTTANKFKQKKALAFCGIAQPHRFIKTLEEEGIKPAAFLKFPDHFEYPLKAVQKIIEKHKSINSDVLITTEKDAVKLEEKDFSKDLPLYYLKIDLDIEQGFFERVFTLLKI